MKKYIIAVGVAIALVPSFASASTLSSGQISAIILLLQAFGVDQTTITNVESDLNGTVVQNSASTTPSWYAGTQYDPANQYNAYNPNLPGPIGQPNYYNSTIPQLTDVSVNFLNGYVSNTGDMNATYSIKNNTGNVISVGGAKVLFQIKAQITQYTYINAEMDDAQSANLPIVAYQAPADLTFQYNPFTLNPYTTENLVISMHELGNISEGSTVTMQLTSLDILNSDISVSGLPAQNLIERD